MFNGRHNWISISSTDEKHALVLRLSKSRSVTRSRATRRPLPPRTA
jgi:hypothetical protein